MTQGCPTTTPPFLRDVCAIPIWFRYCDTFDKQINVQSKNSKEKKIIFFL